MNNSRADSSAISGKAAATSPGVSLSQKDMTFIVSPPELSFHSFEPHKTYEATIQFKNQTKTAKFIRLMTPESRHFSISEPRGGANSLKVAAGLCVTYTVFFRPEVDGDYDCDLIAVTENEKFIVPVHAYGSRGHLSFPSVVHFNNGPIKATTRSTVLVTNTGTKPCEWRATAAPPFGIQPGFGRIESQQSMQVIVEFTPLSLDRFESGVVFDLGHGDTQTMRVSGDCVDVEIALDKETLVIPKTFISLERQGFVTVTNNSDATVDFCWKSHSTDDDETAARQKRLAKLDQFERSKGPNQSFSAQRQMVARRESLKNQPILFDDEVFTIEPIVGKIPAKGSREYVVTFNPQLAMSYPATAFLDIQGKKDRIPLNIRGIGLGPECALSFDSLDLGDIFINSVRQYEVVVENRGNIEAKFAFNPQQTLFGPKFKFSPSSGSIPAGDSQKVDIAFCSDIIGIVSETFKIHVQGSRDELELHIKGRVIGPTFHFDVEELDYGNVSYNFWHVKNFNLVNTSEIPMRFHLRVPEDNGTRKEFDVIPPTGTILPHGKQKIQVDFLSNTVQEYNNHLVVDIDEVGDNLDSLPIKATCIVPDVVVSNDALDYGHCFVNNKDHRRMIELRNDTALSAKYEFILPAEEDPIRKKAEITIGSGDPKERKGIVHARSSLQLSIQLVPKQTGNIHLPLYVRILGSDRAPHHIAISAKVTGPKVVIQPQTVDFGSTEVLKDVQKFILIENESPIPAQWAARLTAKHPPNVLPPFTLKEVEGEIPPGGSKHLEIDAHLDEAMKFTDELAIAITNNVEHEIVNVTAQGRGYTLVPSIPLDPIDFGDMFTTVPVKRTFTVYNKGRRPQQIQWNNERGKAKEGDPPIVYSITPERTTILGKSEETFTIEALSNNKGTFTEKFTCKISQTHKAVFKAVCTGSFQPPLLQYSANLLQFGYTYDPEGDQNFVSSRPLTMKNVSPLDLDFSLKVGKSSGAGELYPFHLEQTEFHLKRDESVAINISFDAAYRGDRVSHKTTAKLTVNFANHGQKDTISLSGEMHYPNLKLDTDTMDFGCILNDTEQRKVVTISNSSTVAATYTWVFEEEDVANSTSRSISKTQTLRDSVPVPINNVFDLIPFRGTVAPGATERVEVLFCGIPGQKFSGTAMCQVEGGPDYPLQLLGEASSIHYKFDRVALDYGSQEYDKWEEREIIITNNGRVPFPFQVDLSVMSRPGMIEVIPMSGQVKDKAKLIVRFSPRVPDRIDDSFRVQVAHFEPQAISVRGLGLYSSVVLSALGNGNYVSRDDPANFKSYLNDAQTKSADPEYKPYTPIPTTKGGEKLIDPVLSEAERMYFRDIIIDDAMMMKSISNGEAAEVSAERSAQVKRKTFSGDTKYILSRYVIDLGNVVKGESKRRVFKVTNTSTSQLTFMVDRRALATTGVTLSPDKYPKLAPHTAQNIEVTLNTRFRGINVGNFSQEVILDIKGGPLVLLDVRAFVILPQVQMSTDKLEFGNVLVGMTRILSFMIENTQALPCDWSAVYPELEAQRRGGATADRNAEKKPPKPLKFVCSPEKGTLQPNQKAVVQVSFIPTHNEQNNSKINLRVSANPKMYEVQCSGTGEELDLNILPNDVDLPPVFPYQNSRRTFQLVNNSSVPIEVFSYNFDNKYLIEEEILRNANEHFEKDVLLLPVRGVGASLPDFLMETYFKRLEENDSRFAEIDLIPDEGDRPGSSEERPPAVQPSVPLPPLQQQKEESDAPKPVLVVVTGPPLSGKSTHAKNLSRKYGLVPLSIDSVVEAAMEIDSIEGATFRTLYHRQQDPSIGGNAVLHHSMLATVIRERLASPDAAFGAVVDDLSCSLTSNGEVVLMALKEAAQAMGIVFRVIQFAMDEGLINLRAAIIDQAKCAEELKNATMHPLPEDEYDRLDSQQKKNHDRRLRQFRECKRAMTAAENKVIALQEERERLQEEDAITTIQSQTDKEIAEAKAAEDPKAKKAARKSKEPVEEKPVTPWEELEPVLWYKRVYTVAKAGVDDAVNVIVACDQAPEETLGDIMNLLPLPKPEGDVPIPSASPEKFVAPTENIIIIPEPETKQRIERPPERRVVKPVKFFRILTPTVREVPIVPEGKKADSKSKNQPPQTRKEEILADDVSRWIIEAKSSVELTLQFCCDSVTQLEKMLNFGVVGITKEEPLQCRVAASYPEIIRDPKAIFNRKVRGADDRMVAKAFVSSRKTYEFGPLLVLQASQPPPPPTGKKGKEPKPKKGEPAPVDEGPAVIAERAGGLNSDKLRFTNTGLFSAEVSILFENEKDRSFCVIPSDFTLGLSESVDVQILAQPADVGEIRNAMVVCIQDNPEPLKIDVSCIGSRPEVTIDGKKDLLLDFGRLLLRRSESRSIPVKNTCKLPVKWRLVGVEKIPPEMKIDVTSGTLKVNESANVNLSFCSERANALNVQMKLEVTDMDETQVYESLPFNVKGEAHDVVLEWTKEIDFKTIRVGETKKENIRMINKGPYEVQYMFRLPRKLQDLITITPMEGSLRGMTGFKDAAVTQVEVSFKADKEVQMLFGKRASELEVSFIEPTLKELVYPVQAISVRGEALYNKFQIKPMHINFGPCLYKQKKQAFFDIVNTGCFELKYKLFSMKEGLAKALEVPAEEETKGKKKPEKKKKNEQPDVPEMQIGAFTISPAYATIPIGATMTVTCSIFPEGSSLFNETLGIHLEDRDPSVHPNGIPFELEAESCVPGIIANLDSAESDSIFEEQQIVSRLDGFKKLGSAYSRDDQAFSFGTTLSSRRISERFRITNPVKVPCTVSVGIVPRGDAPDAKLAAEAFDVQQLKAEGGKLTIPPYEHRYVTVGFTPNSLNSYSAIFEANVEGGTDPKTKQLRFELRGDGSLPNITLDVPPPPLRIQEAPQPAETGKGKNKAAPAKSAVKEEDKVPPNTLVLPRTILGEKSSRMVTVRNTGELPAVVRFGFPMSQMRNFSFPSRNEDITLLPGAAERYSVFFEPQAPGDYTAKLTMSVQDNHYEDTTVNIQAECYTDTITFDDVDENTENKISLGDCYVDQVASRRFHIKNHAQLPVRFAWKVGNEVLKCSPAVGHLQPGAVKAVDVELLSSAAINETVKCSISFQDIVSYASSSNAADWDSSMVNVRWVSEASPAESPMKGAGDDDEDADDSHQGSPSRRQLMKVVDPVPEPEVSLSEATGNKDVFVSFNCDFTNWEVVFPEPLAQSKALEFKKTKLFQQRTIPITLKNVGKVALPFNFDISSITGESLTEDEATTYEIEPATGTIAPGQNEQIKVTYKPLNVAHHALVMVGSMPHGPNTQLQVPLSGVSECPLVHFEMPHSNYLDIRDMDLAPVDSESVVMEFFSRGVKIRNVMRFMVLNPTNLSWEFEWVETKSSGQSFFKCNTYSGTIHSGKKYEMVFEFYPETLKLQESTWTFNIVGKQSIPFLLVGHAAEPEVYFSQTRIQFGQVIVGARQKQTVFIENRESVPYPFTLEKLSPSAAVSFSPLKGTVPPKGQIPVDIIFAPQAEEAFNYTINCIMRKAVQPITCNIKGEGYVTHDSMRVVTPEGVVTNVAPNTPTAISFGNIQVNSVVSRKIILSNQGRFNLDYKWQMTPHPSVTLGQMLGTVVPGTDGAIELQYAPTKEALLKEHKLSCKVTNGSTYSLILKGAASVPNVTFSWKDYNFGPSFVYMPGHDIPSVTLTMANKDKQSIAVDCLFENKEYLEVDVSSFMLPPGEKRDIKVSFLPRDTISYAETIRFSLNDLTTMSVNVAGEGTLPKVEVLDKFVRFGTLRIGDKKDVEVRVTSRSRIPVPLSLEGMLPPEFAKLGVTVIPETQVFLKPKETRTFMFSFRPQGRLRPFNGEMNMIVYGQELPFIGISGCCHGAEVHLDNKQITFGQVVAGTKVTKRITIMNTGDLNLEYNWAERRLAPDYTMNPASGFLAAHSEQVCDLTYQPSEPGKDGKRDNIEIRFSEAPPLSLSIQNSQCVERPTLSDIVPFSCRVRETTTNKVTIKNESSDQWTLRPVIENNVFSGPETLVVRPRESADYVITYAPMVCTKNRPDEAHDSGSVFFPLPTGTAMLFRLDGQSEPPASAGPPIERDVVAKVQHVEKLTVSNWLKVPQRFNVSMKWSNDPSDDSVVIKGVPSLDVPPNSTRDYKVMFSSFKEGKISGSVNFINEETKEYQFYNLVFNVKSAKEVANVDISTPVRVRKTKEVSLSNPLGKQVTLTAKSENPELIVPATVVVPAKSTAKVPLEFFPLLVKEHPPAKLVFTCAELGEFPFTVSLVGTAPLLEKPVRVQCSLGQQVSTTIRFNHYAKTATDFVFKFLDPKQTAFFKSNNQNTMKVTACPDQRVGQELAVDVTFEPGRIGEFKENIEITSNVGGTYAYTLHGSCAAPQRQGPIDIRPNMSVNIPFKNVFAENVTFSFSSDNTQFVLPKAQEAVQAKKPTNVQVQYKPEDSSVTVRGKLTITGVTTLESAPVSWVYYLRGLRDGEVEASSPAPAETKGRKK